MVGYNYYMSYRPEGVGEIVLDLVVNSVGDDARVLLIGRFQLLENKSTEDGVADYNSQQSQMGSDEPSDEF